MFRFKHFSVSHHRSAMKVGVDGVLIGCWAEAGAARNIMDVGCGCGLISLIMAQRYPSASIIGIDIDTPSVAEARENAALSPWSERLQIRELSFPNGVMAEKLKGFDLIVSNPPYFDSGIADASTRREIARHQGVLSPQSLIAGSVDLLDNNGSLAMVIPYDLFDAVDKEAHNNGLTLVRKCMVRGHGSAPWKRVLLQWKIHGTPGSNDCREDFLTLETAPGFPTDEYRFLCKDFYLKF